MARFWSTKRGVLFASYSHPRSVHKNGCLGVSQQWFAGSKQAWHSQRYQILWSGKERGTSRQINCEFHNRSTKFLCFNYHTYGTTFSFVQLFKQSDLLPLYWVNLTRCQGIREPKCPPPFQWKIKPHFPQANFNVWGLAVYHEHEGTATEI
jgi:hypothetical protein